MNLHDINERPLGPPLQGFEFADIPVEVEVIINGEVIAVAGPGHTIIIRETHPSPDASEPQQKVATLHCKVCDKTQDIMGTTKAITDMDQMNGWEFTSETGWLCPEHA